MFKKSEGKEVDEGEGGLDLNVISLSRSSLSRLATCEKGSSESGERVTAVTHGQVLVLLLRLLRNSLFVPVFARNT